MVVTDLDGLDAITPLLPSVPTLKSVILLDPGDPARRLPIPVHSWDRLPESDFPDPGIAPSSIMSTVYTSGTTGPALGCILSHGYYARVGQIDSEMLRLGPQDVFFTSLPMFHAGASSR